MSYYNKPHKGIKEFRNYDKYESSKNNNNNNTFFSFKKTALLILIIAVVILFTTHQKQRKLEEKQEHDIQYVNDNAMKWLVESGYTIDITDAIDNAGIDINGNYYFYFSDPDLEYTEHTISNIVINDRGDNTSDTYTFDLDYHAPIKIENIRATINISAKLHKKSIWHYPIWHTIVENVDEEPTVYLTIN